MGEVEYVSSDEEIEYDSDLDHFDWLWSWSSWYRNEGQGYKPDIPPTTGLGSDSKTLLFWRDAKSFSDGRIKVSLETDTDNSFGGECSEEKATVYNVHRLALSKTLLQSDSFSENSEGTWSQWNFQQR
jgi:hypothetical protein